MMNDFSDVNTMYIDSTRPFVAGTGSKSITLSGSAIDAIDNKVLTASIPDYVSKAELEDILKRLSQRPMYQHKCVNCGGTVELNYDKAIFICPYCGSHYALNTSRINDVL